MSTIVITLSVFIIAESIWLVGKLEEISQRATSSELAVTPIKEEVKIAEPEALIKAAGPAVVSKGEEFILTVSLSARKDFSSDGMDVVLTYDSTFLEPVGVSAKINPDSLFKTAGLNLVEEDKARILVTILDLQSPGGVAVRAGDESDLFTFGFKALKTGKTVVVVNNDRAERRKTQVIKASTSDPLVLEKEDLVVMIK